MIFLSFLIQVQNIHAQFLQCGHDHLYGPLFQDSSFMNYMLQLEEEHNQMVQQHRNNGSPAINVTIPVIVHVMHLPGEAVGSGNNIPYSDVTAAINNLNDEFTGTGISFCLAKRDQEGNILAEEGVVRLPVSASEFPDYNTNGMVMGTASETNLKQLGPKFSNFNYMNIWVVKTISREGESGQVLGFAYLPKTAASLLDGIAIINSNHPNPDYACFGVAGNKVLVHEVGHYLKLYHTFEGDDLNYDEVPESCPSSTLGFPHSDGIDDTHPHQRSPSGTCPQGANSCFMPFNLSEITNNHMDYSSESCRTEFTEDQKEAMGCTIVGFRPGLQNAMGCVPGCTNPFAVDFTYTPAIPLAPDANGQNGEEGNFTASSTGNTYNWYINGEPYSSGNTFSHMFPKAGFYTVCLRETNSAGCTIETCKEVLVYANGLCYNPTLPNCELLLNGDFEQNNHLGVYSDVQNFISYFPIVNFGDRWEVLNSMCNFYNPIGFFKISKFKNNGNYFQLFEDQSGWAGGFIGTTNKLNLIPYQTYEVSFDLAVIKEGDAPQNFGEFFVALYDFDDYKNNVSLSQSFNHFDQNHKIKRYYFDDVYISNKISVGHLTQEDFRRYSFKFTFQEGMPKNMMFGEGNPLNKLKDNDLYQAAIDNISIKECEICIADPDFTYTEDDCGTFTFTGVNNGGGPDFMYWSVQGGPNIVNQESFTYKFPFHGTYEICLNITCENGITSQKCKFITTSGTFPDPNTHEPIACELCQAPQTAYVSALRCDKFSDVFEVENFTVQIPKGYKPCTHTLYIEGHNGSVNTNSYVFDRTDPSYDYLTVSFTFVADDPNSEMKGFVALCGPDGTTSTCFQFIIDEANTCSSCNETNLVITATCDDSNPNDGIYEYSGSFDLLVGSGYEPCGSTSVLSGFTTGTMTENSGIYTIPFELSTNNTGEFQGNVILCFKDQETGEIQCFKLNIQVVDPCTNGECYLENTHIVTCSKVENGVAYFDIDHALFIEEFFNEGYEPCNNILYPSVETGLGTFSNYYYVRGVEGWITALDLEIPCNRIGTSGNTAITYNFCNGNDHFCFILNLDLLCNSCPPLRPGFKGNAFSEMGIEVYPNPTMDNIHIVNKMPIDLCPQVKLYDLSGKLVLEKPLIIGNNTLDVLFLPQGMYFLKIENSENSDIIKYSIIR